MKAKSGLSAVRQFNEDWLTPPVAFTAAATSFLAGPRDGKGHAALHVGVTNNTAFVLTILHCWQATGTYVQALRVASAADPVTGHHVVDVTIPVLRRFYKISLDVPAPGLGAQFECGAYFQPRADSTSNTSSGGSSSGSAAANRPTWTCNRKTVAAAGTPEQLPAQAVPPGYGVVVKYKDGNTGDVYVGPTSAKALRTSAENVTLTAAGHAMKLYVDNVSDIWIDADNNNDGVEWFVEV